MDLRLTVLETTKENLIHRVRAHPFLERCRNGTITLNELKEYLVQQGLYSAYFTRYLCALMSNLPSSDAVLKLAENLFEELGLDGGDVDHQIAQRCGMSVVAFDVDAEEIDVFRLGTTGGKAANDVGIERRYQGLGSQTNGAQPVRRIGILAVVQHGVDQLLG